MITVTSLTWFFMLTWHCIFRNVHATYLYIVVTVHNTYLALHVHDDDGVGTVAHDKLFDIPGQRVYAVDGDVTARGAP